ncbi:tRNA(Ile)-lysidine synthase [Azospirillum fermentarium]|uniref:tRNA lysidine(34) synthetase TilS n=1 Tax=Azospirillum fermentarium TaxID=1233114 RepID=UPI002226767C|nr:tRNA lysidine(34) synthetase TilS [Azospirillum fermentarium]MCW2245918.1 tRNA(Ile)-lysidine synthase [Azospirillum fermentarium]
MPLAADAFAARMDRLGGFEPAPRVAVGVSGGADSLALVLLAHGWAAARGGSVLALTVDHALRPESAGEAAQVGRWLAAHGIVHQILRWDGDKPAAAIQHAAREARAALLAAACRDAGILHLLLAHHRDDQAETVLMRLSRGSGPDGLAGMAPIRWGADVRVLRPLLDVSHAELAATCAALGQGWVEDPSNRSPAYARGRLRAAGEALAAEGLTAERLCGTARRAAQVRNTLDTLTTGLLAGTATVRPEGWIRLDAAALAAAPEEMARRAVARALVTVGGGAYAPRLDRLERLLAAIRPGAAGKGATLAGCRVLVRGGGLLVVREPAAAGGRLPLPPGGRVLWDGRFTVTAAAGLGHGVTVAALGAAGWAQVKGQGGVPSPPLPEPVRLTLPALWRGERVVAVPHFGGGEAGGTGEGMAAVLFTPAVPLAGPAFPVVSGGGGII